MILRIGYLSTFYHTSVLMIAKNTVDASIGIEVEWKLFGTGPAIVNAFERGELDLAYIGLPPAIIGINRGVTIKCIAGGHVEGTLLCGDSHFRGFPEIKDPGEILKQFAGHAIGVPGKGSIHDIIVTAFLKKFNLYKEIQIINFQWADLVLEAIHKGKISAAVGTPALGVAVKNYLDGKILYPPSRLWPNNPSYGILAENNFLANAFEIAKKFLISHKDALFFLRNRPVEASRIISDYVGIIDKDFVLDTLMVSPKYCACLTDAYIASTMEFVKTLKGLGYINRDISNDEIFDTSLIRKIHPEKDHYGDGISYSV
jgi:NitT/TauT family transport system substrate-binding protein